MGKVNKIFGTIFIPMTMLVPDLDVDRVTCSAYSRYDYRVEREDPLHVS